MKAEGAYLAEVLRAETELLSSRDSHEVVAGRLGISPDVVRSYCNHLVQRSRLPGCTHVQQVDRTSGQQLSWDRLPQDLRQYQGQQYDPELHRQRLREQARQWPTGPGYGYGYGSQPPRRPRSRRHPVRNVLAAIVPWSSSAS